MALNQSTPGPRHAWKLVVTTKPAGDLASRDCQLDAISLHNEQVGGDSNTDGPQAERTRDFCNQNGLVVSVDAGREYLADALAV